MTELDIALHDSAARFVAAKEELERHSATCSPDRCICPTCAATALLLRVSLVKRGASLADAKRVLVHANDFAGAAHPYVASVRVDGQEVYRIHDRPDEVFAPDVIRDIQKALRRPQ